MMQHWGKYVIFLKRQNILKVLPLPKKQIHAVSSSESFNGARRESHLKPLQTELKRKKKMIKRRGNGVGEL